MTVARRSCSRTLHVAAMLNGTSKATGLQFRTGAANASGVFPETSVSGIWRVSSDRRRIVRGVNSLTAVIIRHEDGSMALYWLASFVKKIMHHVANSKRARQTWAFNAEQIHEAVKIFFFADQEIREAVSFATGDCATFSKLWSDTAVI